MQDPTKFKQAFLKNLLFALQLSNSMTNTMSFQQRKNAVKLSADVSMAFVRGRTRWTRALVSNLSMKEENKTLLRSILGNRYESFLSKYSYPLLHHKIQRSKKIIRRSYRLCNSKGKGKNVNSPSVLAKAMVRRRTKLLKKLIPGGESLDGFSLLNETLDYVISLRAQVLAMQCLWKATAKSNSRVWFKGTLQGKEAPCVGQ